MSKCHICRSYAEGVGLRGVEGASASQGWFRNFNEDGTIYYSPERENKRHYSVIGPGDREASPSEMCDAVTAHPNADTEYRSLLVHVDARESDEVPVELPPGCYSYVTSGRGNSRERLEPLELRDDVYLRSTPIFSALINDVRAFIEGESAYRNLGIQHRRGVLLYGEPGNGKTCLIRELIRSELPPDSVVFFFEKLPQRAFLQTIRSTLRDRLKMVVFEELATTLRGGSLERILNFLDGEDSLDHCLILGTTNYPEELPGNIVDRPSRFDKLYRLDDPDDAGRRILLSHFLRRDVTSAEVEATRQLSVAALRELCLLIQVQKLSLDDAAKALRSHRELVKKEFGAYKQIGITASRDYDE